MGELEALVRAFIEAEEKVTRLKMNVLKNKISQLESQLYEAQIENNKLQNLLKEKKKPWWKF